MLFHVPTKPIGEAFEVRINVAGHELGRLDGMESGHLLEEQLLFSKVRGIDPQKTEEKCLPAINRRNVL